MDFLFTKCTNGGSLGYPRNLIFMQKRNQQTLQLSTEVVDIKDFAYHCYGSKMCIMYNEMFVVTIKISMTESPFHKPDGSPFIGFIPTLQLLQTMVGETEYGVISSLVYFHFFEALNHAYKVLN